MIESLENKNIKNIKKLRDKKYRDKENKFVVEIPNVIKEALNNNLLIELYVKENTSFDIDFPVTYIKESIFNKIKTIGTTNVIGIIKKEENDKLIGTKYILLDSIGDPGNLGTIIKTKNINIYTTNVNNGINVEEIEKDNFAIIMGNEGRGVDPKINALVDNAIYIKTNNVESLNVGVATSIIMYELNK